MNVFLTSQQSPLRPSILMNGNVLQRKCTCGQHTHAGGECEACKQKRLAQSYSPPVLQENIQHQAFYQRLSGSSRFVHDFSGVRSNSASLFEEDLRGQPDPDGETSFSPGDFAEPHPTDTTDPNVLAPAQSSAAVQTGETACDVDTGKATASTKNTNECTKDCSMAHEKVHVADISDCCAKAHQAIQSTSTDEEKTKIHSQMKDWVDVNRPFLECRGYSESVKCAEKKMAALKCETASPRPKCCSPLVWYIRSATMARDANCNNAGKSLTPCPFETKK